jgi:hypothetical protein
MDHDKPPLHITALKFFLHIIPLTNNCVVWIHFTYSAPPLKSSFEFFCYSTSYFTIYLKGKKFHLQISKQWILPKIKIIKNKTKEYFPEIKSSTAEQEQWPECHWFVPSLSTITCSCKLLLGKNIIYTQTVNNNQIENFKTYKIRTLKKSGSVSNLMLEVQQSKNIFIQSSNTYFWM